jgi:8-oxo-dGTP pyrophosphatase MutT (NUDIX family)
MRPNPRPKATDLESLGKVLNAFRPAKVSDRRDQARAGVAAILRQEEGKNGLRILLIRRAERWGDPWSGHMAFPGGRMENADKNVFATTLREAEEEIGIHLDQDAVCIGRLSDLPAMTHDRRSPMVLTPFVFRLENEPVWRLSSEVVEKVWVPFSFFMNQENRKEMDWSSAAGTQILPCYDYQNRIIWGLTLSMLDELMDLSRGAGSEI